MSHSLPTGKTYLATGTHQIAPYYSKYWDPPSSFTPAPPTREGWERRNDLSPATNTLIQDVQHNLVGKTITSVKKLGSGIFHMVYILGIDDSSELLARISFNFKSDANSLRWAERKMLHEIALLQFLAKLPGCTSIIPKVIYSSSSPNNCVHSPYMILNRLPGVEFGREGYKSILESMSDQERFVKSLAEAFVDIFNVTLPAIGCVTQVTPEGQPIMGPLMDAGETDHVVAEGPFSNIEQYLDSVVILATVRNQVSLGTPSPGDPDFHDLIQRLRDLASLLVPKDPAVFRISLVHTDTNADNFLINDKVVSGFIDWEVHAALPACLAARYPRFMRSDGIWDSRYASYNQKMTQYPADWPATAEEGEHFRAVFREAVLKLSPEFANALESGEKLRQLVEWVELANWKGQTTWEGCDRWEKETRLSLTA